jgi:hypothetical protein
MIEKICKTCGKEFKVLPYRETTALFCSHKCVRPNAAVWNRGTKGVMKKNSTSFQKGVSASPDTCFTKNHVPWNKNTVGLTGKNSGSFQKGERSSVATEFKKGCFGCKSLKWKGGLKRQQFRMSFEYNMWRKAIFLRDNFTCQDCGDRHGKIHAHHKKSFILFPELRTEMENGVTLCVACHKKEHTNRRGTIIFESAYVV